MSITQRIGAALAIMFVTLMAGAALILDSVVREGFQQLELHNHERDQARVDANFAADADNLRQRVVDYAYWDDTYAMVSGGPLEPYVSDLTGDWMSEYGLDLLIFVDHSDRVLWNRVMRADGAIHPDDALATQLADLGARLESREPRTGMIWLPDHGFMMVSFARATRSDGGGEPRGLVIMGRKLTAAALEGQTQMRIDLISLQQPGSLAERMQQLQPTEPQVWRDNRVLYTLTAMRDPFGRVVGATLTQQPRRAMALGNQAIELALILLGAILLAALAAIWVLLKATVVKPIRRLESHLHAQDKNLRELPLKGSPRDEVAQLGAAYNALIARLRDADAREQAALVQREAEATANRLKSDFLANVSHELRRPLDAIVGYTELAAEELEGPNAERTRADLGLVRESAHRLLTLIGEILDISRIDAGALELRPETFPVASLVRSIADSGVRAETTGELGLAYTDRKRVHQCIVAAIANLRQPSGKAAVTVRASREEDVLRFEVYADGVQLTAQQLASANAPAGRLPSNGLAMLVAQKLLAALGGQLSAHNRPDGAAFTISVAATLEDTFTGSRPEYQAA